MAYDPVCKMEVDEATEKWTSQYEGKTYYFCAPGSKKDFDEIPQKYLGDAADPDPHTGHHH
jgi:YHS domain-containing protein